MYGDHPVRTIASISLGAARPFQLRPKATAAAAAATAAAATTVAAATTAAAAATAATAAATTATAAEAVADTEIEAEAEAERGGQAVGGRGAGQLRYMLLHRSTGKVSLGSVARALSWRPQLPAPSDPDGGADRPARWAPSHALWVLERAASKVSRKVAPIPLRLGMQARQPARDGRRDAAALRAPATAQDARGTQGGPEDQRDLPLVRVPPEAEAEAGSGGGGGGGAAASGAAGAAAGDASHDGSEEGEGKGEEGGRGRREEGERRRRDDDDVDAGEGRGHTASLRDPSRTGSSWATASARCLRRRRSAARRACRAASRALSGLVCLSGRSSRARRARRRRRRHRRPHNRRPPHRRHHRRRRRHHRRRRRRADRGWRPRCSSRRDTRATRSRRCRCPARPSGVRGARRACSRSSRPSTGGSACAAARRSTCAPPRTPRASTLRNRAGAGWATLAASAIPLDNAHSRSPDPAQRSIAYVPVSVLYLISFFGESSFFRSTVILCPAARRGAGAAPARAAGPGAGTER